MVRLLTLLFSSILIFHAHGDGSDSEDMDHGDHAHNNDTDTQGDMDNGDMDHGDAGDHSDIKGYCVVECTTDDPCGDTKGQTPSCVSLTLTDPTLFGYTETTAKTSNFLGCSHTACGTKCATMDNSTKMDIVGDAFCFPGDESMFMGSDIADMAAVGRGCSGSHSMGDMDMVGGIHGDCDGSYSYDGVVLGSDGTGSDETGSDDSSSSQGSVSFVIASVIVVTASFFI